MIFNDRSIQESGPVCGKLPRWERQKLCGDELTCDRRDLDDPIEIFRLSWTFRPELTYYVLWSTALLKLCLSFLSLPTVTLLIPWLQCLIFSTKYVLR
jgi:hypothetical protein